MAYPSLNDTEIQKLKEAISSTISGAKKEIRKKKLKVSGKTLLSSTLVVIGGVAITILFPSPVVIAGLGGAAALVAGNNGVLGDIKGIKISLR